MNTHRTYAHQKTNSSAGCYASHESGYTRPSREDVRNGKAYKKVTHKEADKIDVFHGSLAGGTGCQSITEEKTVEQIAQQEEGDASNEAANEHFGIHSF